MKPRKLLVFGLCAALYALGTANAALLNLPDTPLFVSGSKTALIQLVVERDNKLFFEAYSHLFGSQWRRRSRQPV